MSFKQSGQQFDLVSASRQAELNARLALHTVQKKNLAKRLGIPPSMVTRIIKGERRPAQRIAELIPQDIPARLLPEPGPAPGRLAKKHLPPLQAALTKRGD